MNQLLAVAIDPPTGTGRTLSQNFPSIGSLVTVIIRNAITVAGIVFLGLLIFGGLMYIIGAGSNDSKKAAQGQAIITDALIGFVIVLFAYSIVQIIQVVTGLNILNSSL